MGPSTPQFAQAAYITKSPLYLKRGIGSVTIEGGLLTMRNRKGEPLVERVDLREVEARRRRGDLGGKVLLRTAGGKYIIEWVPEAGQTGAAAAGLAGTAIGGPELGAGVRAVAQLPHQKEITEQFLAAVEAGEGQVG